MNHIKRYFSSKGMKQRPKFNVMVHIKLKGMTHAATWPVDTLSTQPQECSQKVKTFLFLKVVMLYIKLKEMERRVPCKHLICPYT